MDGATPPAIGVQRALGSLTQGKQAPQLAQHDLFAGILQVLSFQTTVVVPDAPATDETRPSDAGRQDHTSVDATGAEAECDASERNETAERDHEAEPQLAAPAVQVAEKTEQTSNPAAAPTLITGEQKEGETQPRTGQPAAIDDASSQTEDADPDAELLKVDADQARSAKTRTNQTEAVAVEADAPAASADTEDTGGASTRKRDGQSDEPKMVKTAGPVQQQGDAARSPAGGRTTEPELNSAAEEEEPLPEETVVSEGDADPKNRRRRKESNNTNRTSHSPARQEAMPIRDTAASQIAQRAEHAAAEHTSNTSVPAGPTDPPADINHELNADAQPVRTAAIQAIDHTGAKKFEPVRGGTNLERSARIDGLSRTESRPAASAAQEKSTANSQLRSVDRARLVLRVSRAFQRLGNSGGTVRLRLHPESLGSVRVEVGLHERRISAVMLTESEQARSVLAENVSALRSRLSELGIQVESIRVEVETHDPGFQQSPTGDHRHEQHDRPDRQGTSGQRTGTGQPTRADASEPETEMKSNTAPDGALDVRL